ncbi:MAG: VRR-NUC domain-containing protein [Flavobacteriaceae bacterium]|nr:VRR-NUC domain-containing protein [Flavobacteriaceae bacterium]
MKYKEDALQMAVANLLDHYGLLWFHCPNERRTSPQAGARLKKKGVKKGVPDVLILERKGEYIGLAIELKIKPNKPTKEQLFWLEQLSNRGWMCDVCYDIDEVQKTINKYLKI